MQKAKDRHIEGGFWWLSKLNAHEQVLEMGLQNQLDTQAVTHFLRGRLHVNHVPLAALLILQAQAWCRSLHCTGHLVTEQLKSQDFQWCLL